MIPKIIHYCWFGPKPLPPLAERCIASWRQHMPEWELRLWSEANFDVSSVSFVREAYELGKYAFVSDYVRLRAVQQHGGLYLDTDVELLRPLDEVCARSPWLAREEGQAGRYYPALGLGFALPEGHWFAGRMLEVYERTSFPRSAEGLHEVTVIRIAAEVLEPMGLDIADMHQDIEGLHIYPTEYFAPRGYHNQKLRITPQTHSVHHYHASWMPRGQRIKDLIAQRLGRLGQWLLRLKGWLSRSS
ncbi:MAG: glycosyltransferase [Porphyromonadaceae bacterium]|nr:glycosyltransferase [Porphyromonadaceae bacterium]